MSTIEVSDIYEDEYGNSYEVLEVNSRSVYVAPIEDKLRFNYQDFNELFYPEADTD